MVAGSAPVAGSAMVAVLPCPRRFSLLVLGVYLALPKKLISVFVKVFLPEMISFSKIVDP